MRLLFLQKAGPRVDTVPTMDFTLSEDQRAFRDTARQFATDRMLPQAARWDAEKVFPEEVLREAAALGFGGIYVRDDVGGSGLSRFDAALIMEELAAACPSTAAYVSIHNMAAWMIDAFGDDDQRRRFLPKLCYDGAFRQLLPHRARGRLGCCRTCNARRAAGRSLRAERQQGFHLRRWP
jgi:alkylation response protein AidB-like acyl-CoA dehydrogenase